MENQVISTFGSAIWILVQVACIAFTAFCAILLGAIQLERAKGAPVHPRATDWTVYLLLVIIAGCGLITLMRSEEHTSELQSLMRISYAVFCLKKKKKPAQKYSN